MSGQKKKIDERIRHYCFTSYEIALLPDKCSYIVYGREVCPDTGRKHLQGYVEFKDKVSFKVAQKRIGDPVCHIQGRFGTPLEASNYCKKGEQSHQEWKDMGIQGPNFGKNADFFEEGRLSPGQGVRTDMSDIKAAVLNGDKFIEIVEDMIENHQQLKFAEGLLKYKRLKEREWPDIYWFIGPTGTGKTRTVFETEELNELFRVECMAEWFDGYWGQEAALFDDFRGNIPFGVFLQLTDIYPLLVRVKGGFTHWYPKRIYITSCKTPEECYYNCGERIDQLTRRIKEVRYF